LIERNFGFVWKGRAAGADNKNHDKFKQTNGNALAACPAESGQITARTNPRGGAIGSHGAVENNGGREDEDSIASYPDQEVVVQEEATLYEIPSGWKLVKLEPDC
jgi:hypothetical protein